MHIIFFSILLSCYQINLAQQVLTPITRSFPITGSYSKNFQDVFSFTANQGALSSIDHPMMGIYSEKRFMLSDLHFFLVSAAFPYASAGVGVVFKYGGNAFFHESQFAVSVGKKITDLISLGMQFNYHGIKAGGEKGSSLINGELGLLMNLAEKLQAGFQIKNIFSINNSMQKRPFQYHAGIGYDCSEKVLLTAAIEKQQATPSRVTVAIHYMIVPALSISCGSAGPENIFFLGIELKRKEEKLQLNAGYHSQLGITPSLALIFTFPKKIKS